MVFVHYLKMLQKVLKMFSKYNLLQSLPASSIKPSPVTFLRMWGVIFLDSIGYVALQFLCVYRRFCFEHIFFRHPIGKMQDSNPMLSLAINWKFYVQSIGWEIHDPNSCVLLYSNGLSPRLVGTTLSWNLDQEDFAPLEKLFNMLNVQFSFIQVSVNQKWPIVLQSIIPAHTFTVLGLCVWRSFIQRRLLSLQYRQFVYWHLSMKRDGSLIRKKIKPKS